MGDRQGQGLSRYNEGGQTGGWDYTTSLYLHGEGNNVLVEYSKSTTTPEYRQNYIYGPTGLIATEGDNTTYYVLKDHSCNELVCPELCVATSLPNCRRVESLSSARALVDGR